MSDYSKLVAALRWCAEEAVCCDDINGEKCPYYDVRDSCTTDAVLHDAASPWHRVEDGLPYENTNALFYDENGYFHDGIMSRFRGYTEFIDFDGNTLHGITHWMPIEPPKEDA